MCINNNFTVFYEHQEDLHRAYVRKSDFNIKQTEIYKYNIVLDQRQLITDKCGDC